jgi:ABC-type molybdate transport system substrate-binding protein
MKTVSVLIALSTAMVISMSVSATEIRVMSGGAPKEVFAQLTPKFEQQSGNKVVFVYDVLTALREKI